MVRSKLVAVAGLVAVALAVAACASSDPEVASDSTRPPGTGTTIPIGGSARTTTPASALVTGDTLVGQTFVSTSVTGHELAPGTQISMTFTDADVTAMAGCNSQGGTYSLQGGKLVVAGDLNSTLMACPEPLMAQDTWFSDFLQSEPTIAATGEGISLTSGDVTIELAAEAADETAQTDASGLVGPTWTATSFVTGDSVMSLPADTEAPTFTFADDGTVAVFTGCNRGSTTYEATDDGVVTFAPVATTKMACPNQNATIIEVAVTTIVNDLRATYAFDGENLVLTGLEGSIVLSPT